MYSNYISYENNGIVNKAFKNQIKYKTSYK